jgi:putative oxidoreductase
MKNLTNIGRILFALPFALLGLNHFFMVDYYLGMLTSFVPGGAYTIIFVGIVLLAASISIMLKKYVQLSCYILAVLLLLFILTIHLPNMFNPVDHQSYAMTLMELLKDIALLGGALLVAGIFKENQ